jgi:hypothetical protein
VQSAASIRHTWPAGKFGTILVTTQIPDFGDLTTSEIAIPAMTIEEGSALIRKHLRRGGSEQDSAKKLSTELGGLPLAIAHFAGYVAKSQCTLEQMLESFQHRLKSSQIWSQTELTSVSGYTHTLETVWNLAFRRLTPDARELLDILAFLESDEAPEEMFVGPKRPSENNDWEYWDAHRFVDRTLHYLH